MPSSTRTVMPRALTRETGSLGKIEHSQDCCASERERRLEAKRWCIEDTSEQGHCPVGQGASDFMNSLRRAALTRCGRRKWEFQAGK